MDSSLIEDVLTQTQGIHEGDQVIQLLLLVIAAIVVVAALLIRALWVENRRKDQVLKEFLEMTMEKWPRHR